MPLINGMTLLSGFFLLAGLFGLARSLGIHIFCKGAIFLNPCFGSSGGDSLAKGENSLHVFILSSKCGMSIPWQ